ncbi:MAG: LuxR C-terminal-related transcriptional regulator [Sumerlaeia bacterium]
MSSQRAWIESLVRCIPSGLVFVRRDGCIQWSNEHFALMVGERGGVKGRLFSELVPEWEGMPEDLPYTPKIEMVSPRRATLTDPEGEPFTVTLWISACATGAGADWAIFVEDLRTVDGLRRQLEAREQSHSFLKASASDLILRTGADWTVTWGNEAAEAYFKAGDALPESLAPACWAELSACLERLAGGERRAEVVLESAPARTPAFLLRGLMRRVAEDDGAFAGVSLVLRDDSEKRRLAALASRLGLSPREEEVAEYLLQGYSNLNIATILGLSESGVKFHIRNILSRAGANTRTELMAMALSE